MKRERLKIIGLYVLFLLVILRFAVVPLQKTLKEKKSALSDYAETWKMKASQTERLKDQRKATEKIIGELKAGPLSEVYPKDNSIESIQTGLMQDILSMAEKEKLVVQNFELPDPLTGKHLTEIPVVVRLRGGPKDFVSFLAALDKNKKRLKYNNLEVVKSGQDLSFNLSLMGFRSEQ